MTPSGPCYWVEEDLCSACAARVCVIKVPKSDQRGRLILYRILGRHAEQMAGELGESIGDCQESLLAMVNDGIVQVMTDRERTWLELTEKGIEEAERRLGKGD
ncbi:MAG: hypothetical protein ACOC58_00155 [Chloroflexota bacterium]